MTNADLTRIINSDEIQSIVKPASKEEFILPKKTNPLKRSDSRIAFNPYHATVKARLLLSLIINVIIITIFYNYYRYILYNYIGNYNNIIIIFFLIERKLRII
jgi:hypothetical protein